jgi:uncharacterized membrane protein YbhN (UPF0104 family)
MRSLRWLAGLALPLALFALALGQGDVGASARRIAAAAPWLWLAPLPALVMLSIDAVGWRLLLEPSLRRRASFPRVLAARTAGETVGQSVPSAGLLGEAASAWYLARRTRVPLGEAIGSLAARRVLLAPGHAALLALAALLGAASGSVPLALVALLAAAALSLFLLAALGSRLLGHAAPFARARLVLLRLPWAGLRAWAAAGAPGLRAAESSASRPFRDGGRPPLAAAACFALVFVVEALETLVLLRLVGADPSPAQLLAVEPLVALLRALAFFAPLGLGVQDLGYVALLHQVGLPDAAAVGAAFVLLKRSKEAAWMLLGWILLLRAQASAATEPRGEAAAGAVHLRVAQPDDPDARGRARVA